MARNYSSISEVKTLAANVPETGAGSTQVIFNEGTTGLPAVPFVLVLNPDTTNEEAVLAISLTGSTYTVTRNIEGGGLKSHTANQEVRHMVVGSDLQLVHNHLDNTTTAHGVTGEVVGTNDEQTLTLKRLTTPKINENVNLTATSTELNVLDGITASTAELNIMDGVTSSAAELNILDGATLSTTELNYVDGVTSAIQTQFNTVNTTATTNTPVGVVNMWVTDSAPTGWLICDGTEKLVSAYPTLADVLSTTYGARTNGSGGAGTTHFRLPDLRGRVPMGAGTGRNVAGDANLPSARTLGAKVSDAETVTLTAAQSGLPQHSHPNTLSDPGHNHTIDPPNVHSALAANWGSRYGAPEVAYRQDYGQTIFANTTGITISNANAGPSNAADAHTNVQPSTVINFIIKF